MSKETGLRILMLAILLAGIAFGTAVLAQDATEEVDSSEDGADEFFGYFNPYGRFLIHAAISKDEVEIQNSASWIGVNFAAGNKVKVIAQAELGVNIVQGTQLNLGANTRGGFAELKEDPNEVFGARLGWVGVALGAPGNITIGKQLSPHYDIAGFTTDRWNVFGGQGSLAYPAQTDGGTTGTGRADQAVIYRVNLFKILDIGAQAQFQNITNDEVADGYGVSARVTIIPGLVAGAAYTHDNHGDEAKEDILGLDGDGNYLIGGARFTGGILDLGAVVATQTNGDLVRLPGSEPESFLPVAYDGTGFELYARVRLGHFFPLGGLILYEPDSDNPLLADDFRTRYAILGGEWLLTPNAYLYGEWRIDDSISATGVAEANILTLGVRYGFAGTGEHGVY